jgi:hypothetical protein
MQLLHTEKIVGSTPTIATSFALLVKWYNSSLVKSNSVFDSPPGHHFGDIMLLNKINSRLDQLEVLLNSQGHLNNSEEAILLIDSVAKFWSILEEDQKDFLDCARYAVEKQIEWK